MKKKTTLDFVKEAKLIHGDKYDYSLVNYISNNSVQNYFYIINKNREYRFKYRKDILIKQGFDSKSTEHQIMLDRGIYRIYDCGNKKYSLTIV